jgi:hypothetical protein
VSTATGSRAVQISGPGEPLLGSRPPRRRRRRLLTGVLVIGLGTAGAIVAVTHPFDNASRAAAGVADNAAAIATATVTKQDLSSQTQVAATLGYAGSYSVINQAPGIITSLPPIGRVVSQGQVLYEVDASRVVLLYGLIPAYRALSEGTSASATTGPDVRELNADLVALGYATTSEIARGSDEFTWRTKYALERLQAHLGVAQSGTLGLGQAVFLPTAARITVQLATLGVPAQTGGPILTATSTTPVVTIDLDAAQQSEVNVGDTVTITLPNTQTTPGVVSSVGTVATAPAPGATNTSPTVTVDVTPSHPAAIGSFDQAPVEVLITTASAKNALVVPVDGLLALASGGYAVEEISQDGAHHLVGVSLGLFDDANGLVQIVGSGLAAQRIVVPAA